MSLGRRTVEKMTLRQKIKQRWFWGVWVVAVLLVGTVSFAIQPSSSASAAAARAQAAALAQGLSCTKTDKANGGFTLDCDPAVAPSPSASASATASPSPSPSVSPTSSPSPSPTVTTTGPQRGCLANPHVCGFPDATNTGVPAGTALTVVTGNVVLSTLGMTYQGKDVRGCITVTAPNVTIKNVKVTCGGIETGGNFTRIGNRSTA
jgi:hypothetical protein